MMMSRLFRRRSARPEHELYEAILSASRNPAFFGPGAAPDTVDGRFEILALHIVLANRRLRALDKTFAQAVFDQFKSDMEANLRELGTGDARFGKRMKHIVRSLYGRMQAFEEPLDTRGRVALADAIHRNGPEDMPESYADSLAGYALDAEVALAGQALDDFLKARLTLPAPPTVIRT